MRYIFLLLLILISTFNLIAEDDTTKDRHDKIFIVTIDLNTQPSEAFKYFTENELLEKWLTAEANVTPIVLGDYELFWEPEDKKNNSTIGCNISAIIPNQLISFNWRSPKQFKHFANSADPLTHVVVSFIPTEYGTTIHLVQSGWRSGDNWEKAREWQEKAWTIAIKRLAEIVNR